MKREAIVALHKDFDAIVNERDGVEYWMARELQGLLGYTEWRNFVLVIEKAKIACSKAGQAKQYHFVDVNKMAPLGSRRISFVKQWVGVMENCSGTEKSVKESN